MAWTPTSPHGSERNLGSAGIEALAALLALGLALWALIPALRGASSCSRKAAEEAGGRQASANALSEALLAR